MIATEGLIALGVFLFAAIVGALYVANWDGRAAFWQDAFAPAVLMACGEDPVNPFWEDVPGLVAFLEVQTERFDCATLEAPYRSIPWDTTGLSFEEKQASHPMREFPGFMEWQKFHYYLLWTVSVFWSILGVAWSSLLPLYGFLYGMTAVLAYAVFRMCMHRWIALAGVALLVLSPLHLEQLPHLRDYGKAPFFFAAFAAIVWYVRRPWKIWPAIAVASATGLTLGVGLGFRQDVVIALAGTLGAVLLFSDGTLRAQWKPRLIVCGVMIGVFLIPATPILMVLQKNSNAPHDTLIGLLDYTEQRIGVNSPLYDHGDPFLDEYTRAQVETYAWYRDGHDEPLRHYSGTYDHYAGAYFRKVFLYFPADMVTRAFAAVLRVVDELGPRPTQPAPQGMDAWYGVLPFELRAFVAWFVNWGNRYTVGLLLIVLAALKPRWGWAGLCMIYLFAGYTSLRFSVRHAFHLEFLSLWTSGLLIHLAINGAQQFRAGTWSAPELRLAAKRGIRFAVIALVASIGPLWLLRGYQQVSVKELIERFEATPRSPVTMTAGQRDGEAWYLPQHFARIEAVPAEEQQRPSFGAYLVGTVAGGETPVSLTFHFEANHYHYDYTRTITLPAEVDTAVYFPVFFCEDNTFVGVSTDVGNHERLGAWEQLDTLEKLPLYVTLTLPEDWGSRGLWQGFSR